MIEQDHLFALPDPIDVPPDEESIEHAFWEFHARNPRVYDLLVSFSRQAKDHGMRVGIRAIWERMRWELAFTPEVVGGKTRRIDDFKLNDHYTSRYARLIMERETDLAEFFEIRKLRAE